ncbi:hypothetical protein EOL96_00825 [Candidatus Saccharibacteria bacterium]|nr:hypothetical protein [Candidatus Saccharibacteria bacterium]
MDPATLESLLLSGENPSVSLVDPTEIINTLLPFIILLSVFGVLITVLYIISSIQKMRAYSAVIDIRRMVREMNERSVPSPQTPATPSVPPSSNAS